MIQIWESQTVIFTGENLMLTFIFLLYASVQHMPMGTVKNACRNVVVHLTCFYFKLMFGDEPDVYNTAPTMKRVGNITVSFQEVRPWETSSVADSQLIGPNSFISSPR